MSACLAALFAMQGRREEGRELLAGSRRTIQEFSMGALGPLVELSSALRLETLLNDHDAAERTTRAVAERAREVADNWYYVLASVDLARALCERGDPQQCLRVLDESERHPSPPDIEILVKRPAARARALAHIGRLEDAQVSARDAVAHARAHGLFASRLTRCSCWPRCCASGALWRGSRRARGGACPLRAQGQRRLGDEGSGHARRADVTPRVRPHAVTAAVKGTLRRHPVRPSPRSRWPAGAEASFSCAEKLRAPTPRLSGSAIGLGLPQQVSRVRLRYLHDRVQAVHHLPSLPLAFKP